MAAILKATPGIDSRWTECLECHFPYSDTELGDCLLIVLSYVIKGAPEVWVKSDTVYVKGNKPTAVNKLKEAQKKFEKHEGELASLVFIFQAWNSIPKRERLIWCQQNCVDNAMLSQLEEVVLNVRQKRQETGKNRSLRSSSTSKKPLSKEPNLIDRLALFLLQVFPDCLFLKWHTGQKYLNCITHDVKVVSETSVGFPDYILCLPNLLSPDVSLVVPQAVAQYSGDSALSFQSLKTYLPVEVMLPPMGDAVVLQLAGSDKAQVDLNNAIITCISKDQEMPLSLDVHEPDDCLPGWKLEIHCPAMFKAQVEKVMAEKVRVAKEELESNADTVYFPDTDSEFRLLVGAGGQVQVVSCDQDVVIVHIMRPEQDPEVELSSLSEVVPSDTEVTEAIEAFGKIGKVERIGQFPDETLWGTLWFEHRPAAMRVCRKAEAITLPGNFRMKLVHVDSNVPLFGTDFYWWRANVTSQLHLHFLCEEDLNTFRKRSFPYRDMKYEYHPDEAKVTISSTDPDVNVWERVQHTCEKMAHPKFINYIHHAVSEIRQADRDLLEKGLPAHCAHIRFEDPEQLDVIVDTPAPGASVIEGTIYGHDGKKLSEMDQELGFPYTHGYEACGGELSTRWTTMKFTLPQKALDTLECHLKTALQTPEKQPKRMVEQSNREQNEEAQRLHNEHEDEEGEPEINEEEENEAAQVDLDEHQQAERKDKEHLENAHVEKKPFGDQVEVKIDIETAFVRRRDTSGFKKVPLLLKPYILHIRGDMLAALMAGNAGDRQPNFEQIMKDTDTYIDVVKEKSAIHIYGTSSNITAARERIRQAMMNIMKPQAAPVQQLSKAASSHPSPSKRVTCALCLGVKTGFRLSLCGHPYCHPCFQDLVTKAIETKDFPVRCTVESCACLILTVDIEASFIHRNMSMTDLYMASVQSMDTLRPCLTPDCPMMYHPNYVRNHGLVNCFTCPLCKADWCMNCICAYHFGVSCTVHKALPTINSDLNEWLDEVPEGRKLCPECLKGIEKSQWDFVFCQNCRVQTCWNCMKTTKYFTRQAHRCTPTKEELSDTE